MDRVVAAQAQLLRQVTCFARERHVDTDQQELILNRLEVLDGLQVIRR